MPGEVSSSYEGPNENCPYVPSWCYPDGNPMVCECGCHEGYHNDSGECLNECECGCNGFSDDLERGD